MNTTAATAKSPITALGKVRIEIGKFQAARKLAAVMGLYIDEIFGSDDANTLEVAARHVGPRGNHEPRWSDAERAQFEAFVRGA